MRDFFFENSFYFILFYSISLLIFFSFVRLLTDDLDEIRSNAMDYTTVSFDVEAASLPPLVKMEKSTSSEISSHYPVFPSYDSTSSSSLIYIPPDFVDDLLCQPFIVTPEPSLSPSLFENVPFLQQAPALQLSQHFDENAMMLEPNADLFMASASSSEHLHQNERAWIMVYDHDYGCFKVEQPKSLSASDMIVELSPFDESQKVYTQL